MGANRPGRHFYGGGGGKIGPTLKIWVEKNMLRKFFGAKEKKSDEQKKDHQKIWER